jgi:hypothetical protein
MHTTCAARARRRLPGAALFAGLILIIAALAAGCSGSASGSYAAASSSAAAGSAAGLEAPVNAASATAGAAVPGSASGSGSGASTVTYVRSVADLIYTVRSVADLIYTAQLTVRAGSVDAAISRATSIVTAAGGYVSAENANAGQGQPSQATATVTFKVPAAAYQSTLATLSGTGLGTQLSLSQQAQDVTQQVADVDSRVASDQAAIAQLRALLAHAGSVSSLLSVQDQINSEETDLESMLAQQNALDHETAYATVALTVVGPKAAVKPAKSSPPPGLAGGLSRGWHAFRLTVDWLLTALGAVAPFGLAVVVIGGLGWWGRRRVVRRRQRPAA